MSRSAKFETNVIEAAQKLLEAATTIREMRTAQAILLPAIFGLTREQTAAAIGLSASRVGGIQAEARNPNPQTKGPHGGRRRQTMTLEEEKQFLQPWVEKSASAGMVMVVDGASSHKAKALPIPENISLILLPPQSPQLNPQENVWDKIREKNFPNRVFSTMEAVHEQLQIGLEKFAADAKGVTSLTAWNWIRKVLA